MAKKNKIVAVQYNTAEGVRYMVKRLTNRCEPIIGTVLTKEQLRDLYLNDRNMTFEVIQEK